MTAITLKVKGYLLHPRLIYLTLITGGVLKNFDLALFLHAVKFL